MRLSLIIPCYNEEKNLPDLMARCSVLKKDIPDCEIILVDNGSTDQTPVVMASLINAAGLLSVRVEKNQGYGFGILSGLHAATGDVLAWTHADMQTDPMDAAKGFAYFKQSKDPTRLFVKGRRFGRPIADTAFTVAMALFETILLHQPLWDINAQPTMFSRSFFQRWKNPPHDFSLDLFAYYQARRQQLTIQRFDVYFGKRAHGVSSWNINWKSKAKFIKRTIDFSLTLRKTLKTGSP